jgi:hypothetical protein
MRRLLHLLAALALLGSASSASADWLSRLVVLGEKAGTKAARRAGSLDDAAVVARSLSSGAKAPPTLAATVGQEGHWTLVNKSGEKITAASADEFARALKVLAPDLPADGQLRIVLTRDAVLDRPERLADLPKTSPLYLALDTSRVLPLTRRTIEGGSVLTADMGPSLSIAVTGRAAFDEALAFLGRRLGPRRTRVVSLVSEGPHTLPRYAPSSPVANGPLPIEPIDPYKLVSVVRGLTGQTVFLSGRLDNGLLRFSGKGGVEQSLIWKDLAGAAAANDVNLVALASSAGRQPGTRNWAFQKIEVTGLTLPPGDFVMGDLISGLAGKNSRLVVRASADDAGRVTINALPARGALTDTPTETIAGWMSDLASDIAGRVVTEGIQGEIRSEARDRELDARFIPGLPSTVQIAYLVALVLGLAGAPVSRHWWARVWPKEERSQYSGVSGHLAARTMRGLAFLLAFAPITSPVTAPIAFVRALWQQIMTPIRFLGWLFGRLRRRTV